MSSHPTRYQVPNPLDRMFFGIDRTARRLGLAGRFIHLHLELDGRVDLPGLKRAVAGLHRVYPVTASRLEWSPVLGRPRWRLTVPPTLAGQVVHVHGLSHEAGEPVEAQVDRLIAAQTDLTTCAPLAVHVFRGHVGDLVAVRWPHALMDGQGGALITQEIQRLYESRADPGALASAEDERDDGFAALIAGRSSVNRRMRLLSTLRPGGRQTTPALQLPVCPDFRDLGPIRSVVRGLPAEQASRAGALCETLCPGVRFGAYVRACAIRALDRIMPPPKPAGRVYTVPYLMEGRLASPRRPVCRNLFSLDRLEVPTYMAPFRASVARLLHEETARMLAAGPVTRYLKTAMILSRLPTGVLCELTRRAIVAGPARPRRGELDDTPSLPLGFMRILPDGMPRFCGAPLRRAAIFRPPFPRTGLAVQVTAEHGRLTLYGLAYACRVKMLEKLLDEFAGALLDERQRC